MGDFDDDEKMMGRWKRVWKAWADDGRGFPIRKEGESELSARYLFPVSYFLLLLGLAKENGHND